MTVRQSRVTKHNNVGAKTDLMEGPVLFSYSRRAENCPAFASKGATSRGNTIPVELVDTVDAILDDHHGLDFFPARKMMMHGKEPIQLFDYSKEAGAAMGCTWWWWLIKGTHNCGQPNPKKKQEEQVKKWRELFLADGWFCSVITLNQGRAMNEGKAIQEDEEAKPAGPKFCHVPVDCACIHPIKDYSRLKLVRKSLVYGHQIPATLMI
jgi:hypothetical protein